MKVQCTATTGALAKAVKRRIVLKSQMSSFLPEGIGEYPRTFSDGSVLSKVLSPTKIVHIKNLATCIFRIFGYTTFFSNKHNSIDIIKLA